MAHPGHESRQAKALGGGACLPLVPRLSRQWVCAVVRLLGVLGMSASLGFMVAATADTRDPPLPEIQMLLETEWLVTTDVDWGALRDAEGLMAALSGADAFAAWEPASALEAESARLSRGSGVAADLTLEDGRAYLLPRQGGPLARLGLVETVELLAIDGMEIDASEEATSVARRLRGEPGTRAALTIRSPSSGRHWDAHVLREAFRPLDVELWVAGPVSLLRILEFVPHRTRNSLHATLQLLGPETEVAVLDLRAAGGGELYEAIDAADLFLEPGLDLLQLERRNGEIRVIRSAARGVNTPALVLLVGPQTASAAEIFAGILQYHGRALLVGEHTFGKCRSQSERRLSDGSLLRFSNLELRFPDGSSCSGVGLSPDESWDPPDVWLEDLRHAVRKVVGSWLRRDADTRGHAQTEEDRSPVIGASSMIARLQRERDIGGSETDVCDRARGRVLVHGESKPSCFSGGRQCD